MGILSAVSLLLIAFFLVFAFSAFITSLMHVRTLPAFFLSLYILSFANIVFVGEVAGTFSLLRSRLFFLIIHLVLTVLAGFIWWQQGHPTLMEPVGRILAIYKQIDFRASIKKRPDVWLLATAAGLLYLFGAYLILKVPPNNYDSMTCHMTRIGYWLQHGNFLPWPTWDYTQQVYPLNAQIAMLWTILFWGWDQLAGFPQWISALAGMLTIFGIARLIGWTRPQSIFAALIWALLPEVVLESTTVQNHLIVAVLFACTLYFLFLGVRSGNFSELALSGLALGLGLGTHQLAFLALPGLLVSLCFLWLKFGQRVFKSLLIWGVGALIAFLLVGSYMYVINFSLYGNPFEKADLGNPWKLTQESQLTKSVDQIARIKNFSEGLIINFSRYFYSSLDTTGLPTELSNQVQTFRVQTGSYIFDKLNIQIEGNGFSLLNKPPIVSEDFAWFGVIGFFFFPLLSCIQVVKGVKTKDPYRLSIFIILITYISIWSAMLGKDSLFSPHQGRYHLIMAVILAPFISSVWKPSYFFILIRWLVVMASILIAYNTTIYNYAKPLVGFNTIWSLDRIEYQTLNSNQFKELFHKIDKQVSPNEVLGLALSPGFFEYPLFGKGITRTLVPIYPDSMLGDSEWIAQRGINKILLCKPSPFPDGLTPQGFNETHKIFVGLWECRLLKRTP